MVLCGFAYVTGAGAEMLPGDANCDGRLDAADLAAVVHAVFVGSPCPGADVNGDGQITAADIPA